MVSFEQFSNSVQYGAQFFSNSGLGGALVVQPAGADATSLRQLLSFAPNPCHQPNFQIQKMARLVHLNWGSGVSLKKMRPKCLRKKSKKGHLS